MIAVSGWLIDEEDYKRMYGIVPDDLTLEERLERFYEIYCPERLVSLSLSHPFPQLFCDAPVCQITKD
jgi:hypothetical protein